ncbi:MAG: AraC family transcriptional regulator [Actinomycetota bacterium]|nr:AraC family transcriptional regulator [Actinomycetota bacterium]
MPAMENNAVAPRAAEESSPGLTPVLTSAGRGWTNIELMRYTGYIDEIAAPSVSYHLTLVYLGRSPHDVLQRLDGRVYEERFHQGEIAIVPAGLPCEWSWKRRTDDILEIRLGDALLREVAQSVEVDPDDLEIVHRLCAPDPQIERIGLSLKEEAEADGLVGGKLYAESLANALSISLIRDHSSFGRKAVRKAAAEHIRGLTKRALKEVIDYVGDNLANKDLTLAEMAGTVHMSPYHFSRLFKESTGLAPHQYVIERRVRRAEELLSNTSLPIAEIALLCGFAHQSHLNRHFKRLLGVNPKALR